MLAGPFPAFSSHLSLGLAPDAQSPVGVGWEGASTHAAGVPGSGVSSRLLPFACGQSIRAVSARDVLPPAYSLSARSSSWLILSLFLLTPLCVLDSNQFSSVHIYCASMRCQGPVPGLEELVLGGGGGGVCRVSILCEIFENRM